MCPPFRTPNAQETCETLHWEVMTGNLFDAPEPTATSGWFTAHCDGGSRGNPGPAGYGAVIEDAQGRTVARLSEFLGVQTNNFAEYHGLLAVLRWAVDHGVKHLRVVSDSELMVRQMEGRYKVASPILRPLWEEAKKLARRLERFEMRHTLRGGNKEADALANQAMDKGMGKTSGEANAYATRPTASPTGPMPAAKPARQVLEGFVKGGVVHLLEGELPDGIFVKIIRE